MINAFPNLTSIGGNLALVQNGDLIELDVENRLLQLHVTDEELAKRRAAWKAPDPLATRGYVRIYLDHVEQAEKGADTTVSPDAVPVLARYVNDNFANHTILPILPVQIMPL